MEAREGQDGALSVRHQIGAFALSGSRRDNRRTPQTISREEGPTGADFFFSLLLHPLPASDPGFLAIGDVPCECCVTFRAKRAPATAFPAALGSAEILGRGGVPTAEEA
jgi:hypothetical protein